MKSSLLSLLVAFIMAGICHSEPAAKPSQEKAVELPVMTWFHPLLPPGVSDMVLLCTVVSVTDDQRVYDNPYWKIQLRIDERIFVDERYQKRLEGVTLINSGDFRQRKMGDRIVLFAGGESYEGSDFLKPCWSGTATDLGILLHPPDDLDSDTNDRLLDQLRKAAKGSFDEAEFMEAFAEFCPKGVAHHFIRKLQMQERARKEANEVQKSKK